MEFVTRERKAKGKQSGQHNRYVEVLDSHMWFHNTFVRCRTGDPIRKIIQVAERQKNFFNNKGGDVRRTVCW